jgi:hypothetical protein
VEEVREVKITLENTSEVGGSLVGDCPVRVPARIWVCETESGVPVVAFITRIGVPAGCDPAELERELAQPPTKVVVTGDPS